MINNYIKRSAMLLCAAALIGTSAMAETKWQNVNYYLGDPSGVTGWSGAFYQFGEGVAEIFGGAGRVYQTVENLPAGEYTLTVNAFYRGSLNNAYIYINGVKKTVVALDGDENDLAAANTAFQNGKYLNTLTVTHEGGDMTVGICNPGGEATDINEWMAFDNFKLAQGSTDITDKLTNPNFDDNAIDFTRSWTCENGKKPDATRGGGGVYRKTNASPYDIHQTITLPAGTYRFAVTSFWRPGNGNLAGEFYGIKGNGSDGGNGLGVYTEGTSGYDNYVNGLVNETNSPHIYVHEGEWDNDEEVLTEDGLFYKKATIKCLFDLGFENTQVPDNSWEGMGIDSGDERYGSKFLFTNEELCTNAVEFTLNAETVVSVGLWKKNNQPGAYWHPFADLRIEKAVEDESAIEDIVADTVDENAPVEYYNLQGVKVNVENAAPGLYIVKQGKKVTKQIIRK